MEIKKPIFFEPDDIDRPISSYKDDLNWPDMLLSEMILAPVPEAAPQAIETTPQQIIKVLLNKAKDSYLKLTIEKSSWPMQGNVELIQGTEIVPNHRIDIESPTGSPVLTQYVEAFQTVDLKKIYDFLLTRKAEDVWSEGLHLIIEEIEKTLPLVKPTNMDTTARLMRHIMEAACGDPMRDARLYFSYRSNIHASLRDANLTGVEIPKPVEIPAPMTDAVLVASSLKTKEVSDGFIDINFDDEEINLSDAVPSPKAESSDDDEDYNFVSRSPK